MADYTVQVGSEGTGSANATIPQTDLPKTVKFENGDSSGSVTVQFALYNGVKLFPDFTVNHGHSTTKTVPSGTPIHDYTFSSGRTGDIDITGVPI